MEPLLNRKNALNSIVKASCGFGDGLEMSYLTEASATNHLCTQPA